MLRFVRAPERWEVPPILSELGSVSGGALLASDVGTGILVTAPGLFRMHIDNGATVVTVDVTDHALSYATQHLLSIAGSVCASLLGDIPLHAAAARIDGRLVGLMAKAGTGKSTTLWALMDRGATFVSDDILPLRLKDRAVLAVPSVSPVSRMCKDALAARNMKAGAYQGTSPEGRKVYVPVDPGRSLRGECPLAALFVLLPFDPQDGPSKVAVRRYGGGEAVTLLLRNTQHLWAVFGRINRVAALARYATVADRVPVFAAHYPKEFTILPRLLDAVQRAASSGGAGPGEYTEHDEGPSHSGN